MTKLEERWQEYEQRIRYEALWNPHPNQQEFKPFLAEQRAVYEQLSKAEAGGSLPVPEISQKEEVT